ncbi:AAA family ATPase [Salinibius halmophilus]|uniref:AAA family ATPase n=1 Tax=Salinibius halmophilus TaxID=1853216 RepID=UPI000E66711A
MLSRLQTLQKHLAHDVIGQGQLLEQMLVTLLADGHLLVEGPPGIAKTRAINALASQIDSQFKRIQFTPDLLPADLTGTEIFRPQTGDFVFEAGPLLNEFVLADEINRAPAKVQSALLEAMAERQVTVGKVTRKLPALFMVMATQNPIEQEGTYPLPEAQLDRFLMKIDVNYPSVDVEHEILRLNLQEAANVAKPQPLNIAIDEVLGWRREVLATEISSSMEQYIVHLVQATRQPEALSADLAKYIEWGASPRATIALARCAQARAFLHGRRSVYPEDIQWLAKPVLRHRILLSYEAEADGLTPDIVISQLLNKVAVSG